MDVNEYDGSGSEEDLDDVYEEYLNFKKSLWDWVDEYHSDLSIRVGAIFVATAGLSACIEVLKMPVAVVIEAVNTFRAGEDLENMPVDGPVN